MNEAKTIGSNALVLDTAEENVTVMNAEESKLGKEVSLIEQRAEAVIVASGADFEDAGLFLKQIKQAQKQVKDYPISIALELDADVQITYNPGAFITSAEAEELVRTMVQEAISGVGTAIIKDITIPHTGWTWQEENPGEQGAWDMDEYRYYVDVPVTEAAETQFPNVALHKAALETAKNAGLCPTVQTLAGALRFWAKRSPDEDMEATIALVSPGASSSGGGGGSTYVLPVATATRLGGVKIGKGISVAADGTITASTSGVSPDDMASTEDTESMLDEVFPSEDENP